MEVKYSPPVLEKKLGKPVEIIADRLYWVADVKPPTNFKDAFFFNIDNVSTIYNLFTLDRIWSTCPSIRTLAP